MGSDWRPSIHPPHPQGKLCAPVSASSSVSVHGFRQVVSDRGCGRGDFGAAALLCLSDWAASINLKDTYFHVPVNRRFLRFGWRGLLYENVVLPFGLCMDPLIFTLMRSRCKPSSTCGGFIPSSTWMIFSSWGSPRASDDGPQNPLEWDLSSTTKNCP